LLTEPPMGLLSPYEYFPNFDQLIDAPAGDKVMNL
jgi:hypothetical protein